MNKAMIEVIPSSHLQIGNPQAISYFDNVYHRKKKTSAWKGVLFASPLILSLLAISQTY